MTVEANLVNKNESRYQTDAYDGPKKRAARVHYDADGPTSTLIELLDAGGLNIVFTSKDDCMITPGNGFQLTGPGASSSRAGFAFIGASPDDTYAGSTVSARGIPTDIWVRNVTDVELFPGSSVDYDLAFEYSTPGWGLRAKPAPIRATVRGTSDFPTPHDFYHVYEFINYNEPESVDQYFKLPAPVSFNAANLKGFCNATAITDPAQKTLLLGLSVDNGGAYCDGTADPTKAHPFPELPNVFEVTVAANIVEKNYTSYMREFFDGSNDRIAFMTSNSQINRFEEQRRIELGEDLINIVWTLNDDGTLFCEANAVTDQFVDARTRSANNFLESEPGDKYCGSRITRGIPTDVWVRNKTTVLPFGAGEIGYNLAFEFSKPGSWDFPINPSPVRAYLDGFVSNAEGSSQFSHIYDFYDFKIPEYSPLAPFEVPLPFSFDENDLEGYCNATALKTDAQKAAVLKLPVQSRLTCTALPEEAKDAPLLPDQYEVRLELNVVDDQNSDEKFTSYQHDFYDGPNNRVATTIYTPSFEHRIELGDADVVVKYDLEGNCKITNRDFEDGIGSIRTRTPHVADRLTGAMQSPNAFIGARPEDSFCGSSVTRGIPTDVFARDGNVTLPDGETFRYSAQFEYSKPGWEMRTNAVPVRAHFEGYASNDGDGYNFRHFVDYFDFNDKPLFIGLNFQLPLPVSFDPAATKGYCNAATITDAADKTAVLGLSVRGGGAFCDGNFEGDDKPNPFPELPNVYDLTIAATILEKNYTSYMREIFDGPNDRIAFEFSNSQLQPDESQKRIELGKELINIIWSEDATTGAITCEANLVTDRFVDSRQRSANNILARDDGEKYCGQRVTRGVPTDVWVRNTSRTLPFGSIGINLAYEFSQPGWDLTSNPSPIRATLAGFTSNLEGSTQFNHIYDFFDFKFPDSTEKSFEVPLPFSFDANDLEGYCNATALKTDAQKAAVLKLPVRSRVTCAASEDKLPPVLPDTYEVRLEFNVVDDQAIDEKFTSYQHDFYDGPNKRIATTTYSPVFEHRIELGDADVAVTYDLEGNCKITALDDLSSLGTVRKRTPHVADRLTGALVTPNAFIGARPEDTYCSSTTTRGIPTDVFTRSGNATLPDGNNIRYDAQFEYSQPSWELRTSGVPVRAHFEGYMSNNGDGFNFRHFIDYFDFNDKPLLLERAFALPLPVSFLANDAEGYCDASSLVTPEQKAAAMSLSVRNGLPTCDADVASVKQHPMPSLPNRYEVQVEFSIIEGREGDEKFTSNQQDWFDGEKNRIATSIFTPKFQHIIELGDADVVATYDLEGNCRLGPNTFSGSPFDDLRHFSLHISQFDGSNPGSYIGANPADEYCTSTVSRGIPTDVFIRKIDTGNVSLTNTFEFSQAGWELRDTPAPVRGRWEGYRFPEDGSAPYNFKHQVEYSNYIENPAFIDFAFQLPYRLNFDKNATNVKGFCDATALTTEKQKAAARALNVRGKLNCLDPSDPIVKSKPHPLPVLPGRFELNAETNLLNENRTTYQKEYYDGPNGRIAAWRMQPEFDYTIELVDAGVMIQWSRDFMNDCVALPTVDAYLVDNATGRLASSTAAIGALPTDQYCAPSEARGIPTEAWFRNSSAPGPQGGEIQYEYHVEFAQKNWGLLEESTQVPVRITFEGYSTFQFADGNDFKVVDGYNFKNVYELYAYHQPFDEYWDRHFEVPLAFSFDPDNVAGFCNATLLKLPEHRAAVQALRVRNPLSGAAGSKCSSSSSSKKKKEIDMTLTYIVAAAALLIGMALGAAIYFQVCKCLCGQDDTDVDKAIEVTAQKKQGSAQWA